MTSVISNLKTKLIAGTVAAALLATSAAPALAWGDREQGIVTGIAGTVLLGTLLNQSGGNNGYGLRRQQRQPVYYAPVYQQPVYQQPVYQQPVYQQPVYQQPVYQAPAQSLYSTPAAVAFNSYSANERIRIQATLANYGYYNGGLDGSFGPGTYNAVTAYASRTGKLAMLRTRGGAYGLFDALIN